MIRTLRWTGVSCVGVALLLGCRVRRAGTDESAAAAAASVVTEPSAATPSDATPQAAASDAPRRAEPEGNTAQPAASSAAAAEPEPPEPEVDAGPPPADSIALAFAGLGTNPEETVSVHAAARRALQIIAQGRPALDAAVAGVVILEDDPSLNAGTGSALRLDGSAEFEAAVMSSEGRFGAVAALAGVKNPVKVARAVLATPHQLLVGAGALTLARYWGFAAFDPITDAARAERRRLIEKFRAHEPPADAGAEPALWGGADAGSAWQAYLEAGTPVVAETPDAASSDVAAGRGATTAPPDTDPASESANAQARPANPAAPPAAVSASAPSVDGATLPQPKGSVAPRAPAVPAGSETVAVLVRVGRSGFAGAVSSGGSWLSLPGRVGDVAIPGGALFVGKYGAVAVTGYGEGLLSQLLARQVYEQMLQMHSPKAAVSWALRYGADPALGVMALDAYGFFVAAGRPLAWASAGASERSSAKEPAP